MQETPDQSPDQAPDQSPDQPPDDSPDQPPDQSPDPPRGESPEVSSAESSAEVAGEHCLNCSASLTGQYCSRCGQRARSRLISIWELIRDAFGDLFELDSRLWQTVIPLVLRPGRLTREYLMGRRARFMPPFRTYLVLSVLFFLVAFFDPQRHFAILLEPDAAGADSPANSSANSKSAAEVRREVLDELAAEGIVVGDPAREPEQPQPPPQTAGPAEEPGANVRFTSDGERIMNCDFDGADLDDLPGWMSRRLTPERLQTVCERIQADSGREFLDQLLDNVPASLFILLPLMALVMKMLYPLSKRYYVEHLLFVLHYHAFVFLVLTLEVLWSRLLALARLPDWIDELTVLVISIYIPVYLYRAMRRVYEQGRAITFFKFVLLTISYLVGFVFIMVITTFYTAFSI